MIRNKPKAIAWQLDRCEVCGNKMHRSKLVRTQVEWLSPAHENYFSYSYYDGTFWVVDTAVDASTISYGVRQDWTRLSLDDSNSFSTINGVQTWTGNGTIRSTTVGPNFTEDVTFSAQVGPYYRNTSPEMTIVMGVCDADGTNKQSVKTYVTSTAMQVWFTASAAALKTLNGASTMCYYMTITNDGNWWVDELQLEQGTTRGLPGPYYKTSGTAITPTSETAQVSSRKVCPDCFEYVWQKSEQYGRTYEPQTDDPVDDFSQEF